MQNDQNLDERGRRFLVIRRPPDWLKAFGMAPTKEALALSFTQNLKRLCWEHEINAQDIADRLGVTPRSARRWLGGAALPGLDKIYQLAELLDTTPRALLREVERGAAQYPEGTLEACNLAATRGVIERPLTGILCDWLTIATAIPDERYRSAWLALTRLEVGDERLLLSRGKIYADGRVIGRLERSKGQPVNGARKILWAWSGLAFRPPASDVGGTGGAGLVPRDCYNFVKRCLLAVVSHARSRVARGAGEDDLESYIRHAEGQTRLSKNREALALYTHRLGDAPANVDYLRAVSEDLGKLAQDLSDEEREAETAFWRGRWSDLIEWPVRATTVDRLDLALELAVSPGTRPQDLRGVTLPHQVGWRSQIASEDGRTEYAGRRRNPLAARGEAPMLTVYTKTDRPGVLRAEVRLPRVTYHNGKKALGVLGSAEWARDIFDALVPWDVGLNMDGSRSGPERLAVPVLDLGELECVELESGDLPVRPYSGHEAKTARRLLRQGLTLVKRYAAIYILASALAHGPARAELVDTEEHTEQQPRTGTPHEIAAHTLIDLEDLYETITGLESYRRHFHPESEGYQVWAARGVGGVDAEVSAWVRERLGGDVALEWPGQARRVSLAGEPGALALVSSLDGQLLLEPATIYRDDTGV